ncbi:MAG: DUF3791 domain-containing protein [Pyramidobacter sp.]|nr:DUF3791 domain-containing protein [Pyramidobacter sp.]
MSRLSFLSFCIENYADFTKRPSDEVYRLFKREGLLGLLRDDYDDLHGMGSEYMVRFCDNYLKGAAGA